MLCHQCSAVLDAGAAFCWKCGVAVTASPEPLSRETLPPFELPHAGKGRRLAAYLLDLAVLYLSAFTIGFLVNYLVVLATGSAMADEDSAALALACIVGGFAYFSALEGSAAGATLGKRALGIRVVGDEGEPLSPGRAMGRTLSRLIPLDGLVLLFNGRNRAIHDMTVRSAVICAHRTEHAGEPAMTP